MDKKKLGAIAAIGLVGSMGIGVGIGSTLFPQTITEEVVIKEYVPVTEVVTETVTETVVEEKIVEVDNKNLALVLDEIYARDGDVELLISGLFDDEVDQIVDRIIMVNDWKAEAENIVSSRFARELERQEDFDRRDVSRVKIISEDTEVLFVDFDNSDVELVVPVEFRYDGSTYDAEVLVEFRDGKALPISITLI